MPSLSKTRSSITYSSSGVDIDAGNKLITKIKPIVAKTHDKNVISQLGGFAALYDLSNLNYKQPILVSCTDGVGTKVKLAIDLQKHSGIGIDLVAMCVNDLLVTGATPLFFLDYYASGKLNVDTAAEIIESIAKGCEIANMSLVGGETAEMPGMYKDKDYDLAGFCVGVVEKNNIIDGNNIKAEDKLIAISSSGPHSNGYSLIRAILEKHNISFDYKLGQENIYDLLLTPTKIYTKAINTVLEDIPIKGCAHITGGGILENLPRILPASTSAVIDSTSWKIPEIFQWLQEMGNVTKQEMWRTFNMGIGLILCVQQSDVDNVLNILENSGEKAWVCGEIKNNKTSEASCEVI